MTNENIAFLQAVHAGANDCYREDDAVTSHISILRSWLDSEDPEKLAYVYDPDDDRFYDRLYTYERFIKECETLIDFEVEESYFSINSFWRKKKSSLDIRHLNAFALDFDYYKLEKYKNLSPEEMYDMHIKPALIHEPSYVIDSGRGIYVIYTFQHASIKRLELYKCIYKQMLEKYKCFGMDPKAINTTQVIRIPGTYNVKAQKTVKILHYQKTEYDLISFCNILPYSYEQTKKYKKEKVKDFFQSHRIHSESNTRKKKCKECIADFKKLIVLRNNLKIYDGYREQLIYIALELLLWSGYAEVIALKKAKELNDCFHIPLPPSAVEKQCLPSRIFYKSHSINRIISKLEITDQEQSKLHFLKTRKNKDLYRKKMRNKHPLLNRTKKEVELLKRRTFVIKLKKKGKSNTAIADSLNVHKSIITLDLQYIQKNKHEFRRVLGETIEALVEALSDDHLIRSVTYDMQIKLHKWIKSSIEVLEDP